MFDYIALVTTNDEVNNLDLEHFTKIHNFWMKPFEIVDVKYIHNNVVNRYAHVGRYRNSRFAFEVYYYCISEDGLNSIFASSHDIRYFPHLFLNYTITRINSYSLHSRYRNAMMREVNKTKTSIASVLTYSLIYDVANFYYPKKAILDYLEPHTIANPYLLNCYINNDTDDYLHCDALIKHECRRRNVDVKTRCDVEQYHISQLAAHILKWYVLTIEKQPLTHNQDMTNNSLNKFYSYPELDKLFGYIDNLEVFLANTQFFKLTYPENLIMDCF